MHLHFTRENNFTICQRCGHVFPHFISDGSSHRLIFDKTLLVKQIDVVEHHGILLLRGRQSGKEFKVYVFRLSQMETSNEPLSRCDLKDHRMDKTRGAHLYSLSRPGEQFNRLLTQIASLSSIKSVHPTSCSSSRL